MSKRPKIDNELHKPIQDYANEYFDGNFTKAVNDLVGLGLHHEGPIDPLTFPEVLDGPK